MDLTIALREHLDSAIGFAGSLTQLTPALARIS
jgi:hypothetical protein